jgi:hypothetical protein
VVGGWVSLIGICRPWLGGFSNSIRVEGWVSRRETVLKVLRIGEKMRHGISLNRV